MKGDTQERHLMAVLRGHGFLTMRSPGSGTGDWDQPDVLAAQQGILAVTELKSGGPPSNVRDEEIQALARFADAFWAASLVSVRFKGDRTFYLVPPGDMNRTPSGHYSIPQSEVDLPWAFALPYTMGDDGVEPRKDVGDGGIVWSADDPPPTLADYLDALTARQQGFQVRRGVLDTKNQDSEQVDDDTA